MEKEEMRVKLLLSSVNQRKRRRKDDVDDDDDEMVSSILLHSEQVKLEVRKEGNVLFNDALNTFYLRLYGVGHMVKYHSDSERKEGRKCFI